MAPLLLFAQQSPPKKPSTDPTATSEPDKKQTGKTPPSPAPDGKPAPATPTREFKPSEAVSSDQEVDFPADL